MTPKHIKGHLKDMLHPSIPMGEACSMPPPRFSWSSKKKRGGGGEGVLCGITCLVLVTRIAGGGKYRLDPDKCNDVYEGTEVKLARKCYLFIKMTRIELESVPLLA